MAILSLPYLQTEINEKDLFLIIAGFSYQGFIIFCFLILYYIILFNLYFNYIHILLFIYLFYFILY